MLKSIAGQTGWRVYVEPGATLDASTKFKNLAAGDALKMLLGDLNFALVPKTGAPWQLYVFRTAMKNATHLVETKTPKHVANELMVKVKPGTDINALAKMLGAKVVGSMDKYGAYLPYNLMVQTQRTTPFRSFKWTVMFKPQITTTSSIHRRLSRLLRRHPLPKYRSP